MSELCVFELECPSFSLRPTYVKNSQIDTNIYCRDVVFELNLQMKFIRRDLTGDIYEWRGPESLTLSYIDFTFDLLRMHAFGYSLYPRKLAQ